ncbi:MAG TPA: non-lysosomal glucosylceramidase [Candidatus Limnocylindrales bacterium]|nr:non-lysosomal glucosylceramidase [Candidatus Limnocylindrales bacterium]
MTDGGIDWPVIPAVAWQRPIGLPCPDVGHPRVRVPMIDDGEWAGVPIGGLGTGSIGRTFRGDAARWHLEVGRHRFEPVAADGFSLFVGAPDGTSRAHVLSTLRPTELPAWGWDLPVGAGTYHALFPRAWHTFEAADVGLRLVGEQLSPVIAGDLERSALPVGVFEWSVENPTMEPLTMALLFSWADPPGGPDAGPAPRREHDIVVTADTTAVRFGDIAPDGPTGLRGSLAIAATNADGWEISARATFDPIADGDLWASFARDGRLDPAPRARAHPPGAGPAGAAIAARTTLAPGERRSIRFALAWDLPMVEFGGGRRWWKRYTRAWGRDGGRALDLARHALDQAPVWRSAIDAWQRPILEDEARPAWYRAALFNELYFLVDGGTFWAAGEVDGPEAPADDAGRFALLECVDYPFYDTVDVDFYASFALLELFPELELAGIRDLLAAIPVDDPRIVAIEASGASAPRKIGWTVPHDIGGPDDDPFHRPNWYRFQDVNDWKDLAPKFVLQVWRDAVRSGVADGDPAGLALVRAAFPTVERVLTRVAAADRDGDGLPEHDGRPDQTYDTWPMHGPSAYGGSLWLAATAAAEAMARALGDDEAEARWADWFERGQVAFDVRLWRGDHYAFDAGGGQSSETIMADQLAGQWYADATGLGPIVPDDRVEATLRTVHARNVRGFAGGGMGPVNGMRPDGRVDGSSEQSAEVWVGTAYALAAFMIGRGLVDEGWDTARGVAAVTYERGLWFRTPEAYDAAGDFRASIYLRPLAIWAIEDALRRRRSLSGR